MVTVVLAVVLGEVQPVSLIGVRERGEKAGAVHLAGGELQSAGLSPSCTVTGAKEVGKMRAWASSALGLRPSAGLAWVVQGRKREEKELGHCVVGRAEREKRSFSFSFSFF
jgi:hypothetical protein